MLSLRWLVMVSLLGSLLSYRSASAEEVQVTLESGRTLVGQVDAATTAETLWLRVGTGQAVIRRPIALSTIISAEIGGQKIAVDQLQRRVAKEEVAALPTTTIHREVKPGTIIVIKEPRPRAQDTITTPAVIPNPPVSARVDAVTANWNANAVQDGLLVSIVLLDQDGYSVPVQGTAEIEWWGAQPANRHLTPVGREQQRLVRWGYWSEQLTSRGYQSGYRLRLPFQSVNPQEQSLLFNYSLVKVRVSVPGSGTFVAEYDGVRVQPWQPARDWARR